MEERLEAQLDERLEEEAQACAQEPAQREGPPQPPCEPCAQEDLAQEPAQREGPPQPPCEPCAQEEEAQAAQTVVGVRFKAGGRMYYFDPGALAITQEDGVIVETARGMEYADVVMPPHTVLQAQIVAPLKRVVRVATQGDREQRARNAQKEREALAICNEKIRQHALEMKLVDVEYAFNGGKITFYFTAEGRVDFRELVKDLAYVFKTRIELRQIGVRDEAKMLGGLGSCGRPVCCKTFLADFQPVSIKMAKEQNLSLSPTKISGLCGRLMCCLKYEQDAYEKMRKVMPRVGKEIVTPDGRGNVLENNAITEKTRVRVALLDGTFDVREYHFSEVRKPLPDEEYTPPVPKAARPAPAPRAERRGARPARAEQAGEQPPNAAQGGREQKPPRPQRQKPRPQPEKAEATQEKPQAAGKPQQEANKPRSRSRRGGRNRRRGGAGGANAQGAQGTPPPAQG